MIAWEGVKLPKINDVITYERPLINFVNIHQPVLNHRHTELSGMLRTFTHFRRMCQYLHSKRIQALNF